MAHFLGRQLTVQSWPHHALGEVGWLLCPCVMIAKVTLRMLQGYCRIKQIAYAIPWRRVPGHWSIICLPIFWALLSKFVSGPSCILGFSYDVIIAGLFKIAQLFLLGVSCTGQLSHTLSWSVPWQTGFYHISPCCFGGCVTGLGHTGRLDTALQFEM